MPFLLSYVWMQPYLQTKSFHRNISVKGEDNEDTVFSGDVSLAEHQKIFFEIYAMSGVLNSFFNLVIYVK